MSDRRIPIPEGRWMLAVAGLFLFVVAAVALSSSGRIDIIDGQPRYEVARSLAEHGDPAICDPQLTWAVLPGREGRRYCSYRFGQSAIGLPAIWLADATGPVRETRRQFFFALTSSFAAGVLATAYAVWFRAQGHHPKRAIGWALAGIFCTPSWLYGTTSFDDILGSAAVTGALVLAWCGRVRRPHLFAGLAGLALGFAVNCKEPLGVFVLPLLALTAAPGRSGRTRLASVGLALCGVAVGLAAHEAYEWYKFPPGSTSEHPAILAQYVPAFPGTPLPALLAFLFSPSAAVLLYCPTLLLSCAGVWLWRRQRPMFIGMVVLASAVFTGFVCCLSFFKGDPCWGPRYLTPVFAVLWLFAPAAAAAWPRRQTAFVLGLGTLVQLLGLSVDCQRLYIELRLPSGFFHGYPWVYFHPRISHLLNRPREIYELLTEDASSSTTFSPTPLPTAAPPCTDFMERGPEAVRKYRYLNSLRPWWASMTFLAPVERPVDLGRTAALLLSLAAGGLALIGIGCGRRVSAGLSHIPRAGAETPSGQVATSCIRPLDVSVEAARR